MTARAAMAEHLSLAGSTPTKTYVVEAHVADSEATLAKLADAPNGVRSTEDAFLSKINTANGIFWVDQIDGRFWSIHTDMKRDDAFPRLQRWVTTSRELDWMWLPSDHLRYMWPGAVSRRVKTDFKGGGF